MLHLKIRSKCILEIRLCLSQNAAFIIKMDISASYVRQDRIISKIITQIVYYFIFRSTKQLSKLISTSISKTVYSHFSIFRFYGVD